MPAPLYAVAVHRVSTGRWETISAPAPYAAAYAAAVAAQPTLQPGDAIDIRPA
jgi:hypothetical protein